MQRRSSLARLILASVVALVLTLLMVAVEAQAQIAFSSNRDGNWDIYVMNADGKNQKNITQGPFSHDSAPSWSPDGERIAFVSDRDGNFEIYVMAADGENQRNRTKNPFADKAPSWSPDGKRIAFVSDRDGHVPKGRVLPNFEIYMMDADGGNQRNLTNNPHDDCCPSWFNSALAVSPAGKKPTAWGGLKQGVR